MLNHARPRAHLADGAEEMEGTFGKCTVISVI